MPPHSITEWMIGQNIRRHKKFEKRPNKPRHVLSFEVLTDDESGSDLYKIAVPRGKPMQASNPQVAREPLRPALKQASKIGLDSTTDTSADVSEETSEAEEFINEEPDPTCPCTKCIRGQMKLNALQQAKTKAKKRTAVAVVDAILSESDSEDDIAAAVHARHQARKLRKKVSFADNTALEEAERDGGVIELKSQTKKGKKKNTAVISMSSGDSSDSEASVVEAKAELKKGKVSMAMKLSPGDESGSEASVETKPRTKKEKRANKLPTPESSPGESESDVAPALSKGAKNKKIKARKPNAKEDTPKGSKSAQKDTKKNKKMKQAKLAKSEPESSESSGEDDTSDAEDTEEETKAQSAKKDKQKGKSKKTNNKGERNKPGKKKDKFASEPESESVSDTEPESAVEVEAPKKTKLDKSKKSNKRVRFPPAHSAPEMRQANLLLPPRSSVMQVEHAVEVPQDPRPNAFYDNDSGVMRVYHGPAYGNPSGMLYPKRAYNYPNLPVGVPHPMQNPWYNGFPTDNGQPAPPHVPPNVPPHLLPHVPPQGGAIDETNPWFRGWGTVGPAPIPTSTRPPPDFTASKGNKDQGYYDPRRSLSPPKDREAGWDSNVIPSIEVTAPNGPPAKAGSPSGSAWGARGASASKRSPDKQAEKRKKKRDANNLGAAISDKLAGLGKALHEAAAKDSADLRAREERWSNRSGSKEPSPQPNGGWDGYANNATNNNNGGGGWGGSTGNNGGWDNNNNNNAGGSGWDAANTNAGYGSSWGNAAANNNNNSWGGGSNSGWNNATTNNNNGDASNGGWGQAGSNSGWNNSTNNNNNNGGWGGGPSNTNNNNNAWPSNDDNRSNRSNNSWRPGGPSSSPVPGNATPIPGTWASPVPSDSGKGKGWGDATLAQSSGGYWDTKEGQADIAKGAIDGNNDAKGGGGNGSW